ncbi:unnamed protein product [Rhizoctonia solani]|uniref:Uncharacterized protein n=1 Tax=Rhizoctonia solani TaxID=456999 RepID=A0A8H3AA44_9AGAM|nr:unnamed protein product [Rhizoctonia solani]
MYGIVAYESAPGTTSSGSQASTRGTQSSRSNLTRATNITHISAGSHGSSSVFSSSQLSQIDDVPQSSPPRHDGQFATMGEDTGLSMLNSITTYPDSSSSSDPGQRPTDEDHRSSVLVTLDLDSSKLNPTLDVDDKPGPSHQAVQSTGAQITYVNRYTFGIGPEEPTDCKRSPPLVASSPMSESLLHAQSATIRPAIRGDGSSPLGGTDSKSSVPESQGTTFGGTDSIGYALSQTQSIVTDTTDMDDLSVWPVDEREGRIRSRLSGDSETFAVDLPRLGETKSLPLPHRPIAKINTRLTLSPEAQRARSRGDTNVLIGALLAPPSDAETEEDFEVSIDLETQLV